MEKKKYIFDIEKIVTFLNRFKENLPILYNWNANILGLVDLEILSQDELDDLNTKSPYKKELVLKKKIREYLNYSYTSDKDLFDKLVLWIIKDWGGITGAKDHNTLELINQFLNQKKTVFNRIASSSKVASYMFPEEYIIYDSRVAYSLNWIILSENAGDYFFPIPEGRNSKMSAFDMNVLIRLKNIENYIPHEITELDKRLYISNQDRLKYIPTKEAYTILNNLVRSISQKLWTGEKSKMLYYTEMLLFSIADREIYNDIVNRFTVTITNKT